MPRIQEVELDFSTLAQLDESRVNKLLAVHLARIAQDCINRPGDKSPRKVSLEFAVVPVLDPEGFCESVRLSIERKSKVPTYRTKSYEMRVGTRGFAFNVDFPDTLDQAPLFGADTEE
jgi:hypothetical protein